LYRYETGQVATLFVLNEIDRLQYLSTWRQFIRREDEQLDNTYRIKHANGDYLLFRDAGSISSPENEAITVAGTYTNVTENIASKARLKLFGDAFKHTRDWVIIFGRNKQPLGANPSFYKAFGISEQTEFKSQLTHIMEQQEGMKRKFISKLATLKPGEHWKAELEFVVTDSKITTLTDVNAIASENDHRLIEYYLIIMTDITEQKEAQIGLIVEMTIQAIERGLVDVANWYEQGFDGYMAINLSAKQFSTRPDLEKILQLLKDYSLPTSSLRFEITEGLLVDNNHYTLDYMHEMRALGFKISLDDFGTGYSSLRYLKDFPIDVLKIDKSFVDDIGIDKGTESIIESTLIMTKMLNMDTVAEGIETRQQVDYFSKTDCHFLQGFYFSKPVSHDQCFKLLQKDWSYKFSSQLENVKSTAKI
jgi:EAL domain-containing protein (putative c-di-GMP-specific phosphodiesterase class I)